MSFGIFMKLAGAVGPESMAMLANLAQHIMAADDPKAELRRLLEILDPELQPPFRIKRTGSSSKSVTKK